MEESKESVKPPGHFIDLEPAADRHRSMAAVIAERRCRDCRRDDTDESVPNSAPKEHIARISEHCANTSDYLLPDTPLKEAIFRVVLAGGNQPMTADEISENLSARWVMTAYPRELSSRVIGRLLDHSQSYCITGQPEPEEEERK